MKWARGACEMNKCEIQCNEISSSSVSGNSEAGNPIYIEYKNGIEIITNREIDLVMSILLEVLAASSRKGK